FREESQKQWTIAGVVARFYFSTCFINSVIFISLFSPVIVCEFPIYSIPKYFAVSENGSQKLSPRFSPIEQLITAIFFPRNFRPSSLSIVSKSVNRSKNTFIIPLIEYQRIGVAKIMISYSSMIFFIKVK